MLNISLKWVTCCFTGFMLKEKGRFASFHSLLYPMSFFSPGIFLRGTIMIKQIPIVRAVIRGMLIMEFMAFPVSAKPKKTQFLST